MSDLGSVGGVEGWMKRADGDMRRMAGALAKARVPRLVTALTRPLVSALQPGVRIWDTDLDRAIAVNAAQTGYVAEGGVVFAAEKENLPTNPPEGLVVVMGNNWGYTLVWRNGAWALASAPTYTRDSGTRNWLSQQGLAFNGMTLYVIADFQTYRYDGSVWLTPGVRTRDLDYGVMAAAGRDGRRFDAPVTADGAINGDWNAVLGPGMYRIFAGNANGNMPANAYPYGTLIVFGAGDSVSSRTQVYYPHQGGGAGQPYVRTAWNGADWQSWTRSSYHLDTADIGYPGAVRNWDGYWFTRVSRDGNTATLTVGLSVNSGSSLSAGSSNNYIGLIPEGYRPLANFVARAKVYVGSQGANAWSDQWYANLAIQQNGQILILGCNPANLGSDCLISGSWGYPTP